MFGLERRRWQLGDEMDSDPAIAVLKLPVKIPMGKSAHPRLNLWGRSRR